MRLVIEIPDDHPWAQHHVAAADIIVGIRRAIEHAFWDLPPLRYRSGSEPEGTPE